MKLKMITHVRFLQARFLTGLLKLVLKREIRKLIPSSIQIETAEKYKDHKIPSVNLFSDSGSSRQQIHSLAVSLSSQRPQLHQFKLLSLSDSSLSSSDAWFSSGTCSGSKRYGSKAAILTALQARLSSLTSRMHRQATKLLQDGGVVSRFSCDFR